MGLLQVAQVPLALGEILDLKRKILDKPGALVFILFIWFLNAPDRFCGESCNATSILSSQKNQRINSPSCLVVVVALYVAEQLPRWCPDLKS